ncbi:hypothetical protein C5167_010026, partial [Papaver somniferum]
VSVDGDPAEWMVFEVFHDVVISRALYTGYLAQTLLGYDVMYNNIDMIWPPHPVGTTVLGQPIRDLDNEGSKSKHDAIFRLDKAHPARETNTENERRCTSPEGMCQKLGFPC